MLLHPRQAADTLAELLTRPSPPEARRHLNKRRSRNEGLLGAFRRRLQIIKTR